MTAQPLADPSGEDPGWGWRLVQRPVDGAPDQGDAAAQAARAARVRGMAREVAGREPSVQVLQRLLDLGEDCSDCEDRDARLARLQGLVRAQAWLHAQVLAAAAELVPAAQPGSRMTAATAL